MKITRRQLRRLIREEAVQAKQAAQAIKGAFNPVGAAGEGLAKSWIANIEEKGGGSSDAEKIVAAISGMGTDEKGVQDVLRKRHKDIPALYREFDALLQKNGEEGDLVEWLDGDGMRVAAVVVDFIVNGKLGEEAGELSIRGNISRLPGVSGIRRG